MLNMNLQHFAGAVRQTNTYQTGIVSRTSNANASGAARRMNDLFETQSEIFRNLGATNVGYNSF